ncbi:MAG: hypothetical protein JO128_14060 [Alphaproteobacteria bacterium]|nr:hypothetical protein [Alphaproteobacteria bacterium]
MTTTPLLRLFLPSFLRTLAIAAALGAWGVAAPALADDHGRHQEGGGHEGRGGHEEHHDHDHDRGRGPAFGFYFGGPARVAPPPVYYAPAYPGYAPVPIGGVYWSPYGYGYCRDYQTMAGIETACQGADGVWRFIN